MMKVAVHYRKLDHIRAAAISSLRLLWIYWTVLYTLNKQGTEMSRGARLKRSGGQRTGSHVTVELSKYHVMRQEDRASHRRREEGNYKNKTEDKQ